MDKIIFYEPYFKTESRDINIKVHSKQGLVLNDTCIKHLSKTEINLVSSLLEEIKNDDRFDFSCLIIYNIGCTKRIVFEKTGKNRENMNMFLIDYYVHKLIEKRKEKIETYTKLCKVLGLGTVFGVFSYLKN